MAMTAKNVLKTQETSPTKSETTAAVHRFRQPESTRAYALTERWGALQENVDSLRDDIGRNHLSSLRLALSIHAEEKARIEPRQLLNDLSRGRGMSWTAISRMLGVSIPAIRKWRNGEPLSPDNRQRLALLYSLLDMLEDTFHIAEVATWMDMRLVEGVPVTPADLFRGNALSLLLELANSRRDGQSALDEFMPNWREEYPRSDFEVFTAADGELSIRRKTQ